MFRRGVKPLVPSIIALLILYFFVWVGNKYPFDLKAFGVSNDSAKVMWILFLLTYSAIASALPVWLLLQPRDFINSHQLIVGLALLFGGVLVAHPDFDAPILRTETTGAPPIFPVLFVTVACGAISGFHGMVASGTTSKQVNKLGDAKLIGYGAMLGEGALALAATLAAVAGIALVGACDINGSHVDTLSWGTYYDTWEHAGANKALAFVLGGGAFLESLGIPASLAKTLMAVLVISFAATTLDTATRIQRIVIGGTRNCCQIAGTQASYYRHTISRHPRPLAWRFSKAMAKPSDGNSGQSSAPAIRCWQP